MRVASPTVKSLVTGNLCFITTNQNINPYFMQNVKPKTVFNPFQHS